MVLVAKIVSLFILFAMTLLFGILPYILERCLKRKSSNKSRYKLYIGLMNCFAGGVFFGSAILNLLPEATEKIEEYIDSEFPITNALVGVGFLLILFIEHAVAICKGGHGHGHGHSHGSPGNYGRRLKHEHKHIHERSHGHNPDQDGQREKYDDNRLEHDYELNNREQQQGYEQGSSDKEDKTGRSPEHNHHPNNSQEHLPIQGHEHSPGHEQNRICEQECEVTESYTNLEEKSGDENKSENVFINHALSTSLDDIKTVVDDEQTGTVTDTCIHTDVDVISENDHGVVTVRETTLTKAVIQNNDVVDEYKTVVIENRTEEISDDDEESKMMVQIRSFVLLLSLSIHMVFEGLAVGLQSESIKVWTLLGILSLHKCIVSFSIGLQMVESLKSLKKVLIAVASFAVVTPVGVVIGIAITDYGGEGSATKITDGVLQGIATGTFFYVTFFEILQKEFIHEHNMYKVLCTIAGFGVIVGLRFLPHHDD